MNENQKKLATEIINFLKANENSVFKDELYHNFDISKSREFLTEWQYVMNSLVNEYFFINKKGVRFYLTKKGSEFTSFENIENLENLEVEKLKTDLKLAQETLKEFPKTKWFARIGLFISILLALKELYILIKK
jgi:predicted transcriptional regulator